MNQCIYVVSSAPRKPVTRVVDDNESERMAPSRGRPATKLETKLDKFISSKVQSEEKKLELTVQCGKWDVCRGASRHEKLT